jgi:CBS domain-containing protein
MTTVADVMTRHVRSLAPTDTVASAARAMDELDVGVIPVCNGDKLMGVVTDRDIVVRAVAQGLDGDTALAKVMSTDIRTARESDDLDTVLADMASSQIRRLPVLDGEERLIGIISIGDIAVKGQDEEDVGQSLGEISAPA